MNKDNKVVEVTEALVVTPEMVASTTDEAIKCRLHCKDAAKRTGQNKGVGVEWRAFNVGMFGLELCNAYATASNANTFLDTAQGSPIRIENLECQRVVCEDYEDGSEEYEDAKSNHHSNQSKWRKLLGKETALALWKIKADAAIVPEIAAADVAMAKAKTTDQTQKAQDAMKVLATKRSEIRDAKAVPVVEKTADENQADFILAIKALAKKYGSYKATNAWLAIAYAALVVFAKAVGVIITDVDAA